MKSSAENGASSSNEETQAISQNIAGTAAKFSALISKNSIVLNNVPHNSYTICISQDGRTLGMTRAIKQK